MNKDDFKPKMLVEITAGVGTYRTGKYKALLRIVSVNTSEGKVIGMQYVIIAERKADLDPRCYTITNSKAIQQVLGKFDQWCDVFNPKILV